MCTISFKPYICSFQLQLGRLFLYPFSALVSIFYQFSVFTMGCLYQRATLKSPGGLISDTQLQVTDTWPMVWNQRALITRRFLIVSEERSLCPKEAVDQGSMERGGCLACLKSNTESSESHFITDRQLCSKSDLCLEPLVMWVNKLICP